MSRRVRPNASRPDSSTLAALGSALSSGETGQRHASVASVSDPEVSSSKRTASGRGSAWPSQEVIPHAFDQVTRCSITGPAAIDGGGASVKARVTPGGARTWRCHDPCGHNVDGPRGRLLGIEMNARPSHQRPAALLRRHALTSPARIKPRPVDLALTPTSSRLDLALWRCRSWTNGVQCRGGAGISGRGFQEVACSTPLTAGRARGGGGLPPCRRLEAELAQPPVAMKRISVDHCSYPPRRDHLEGEVVRRPPAAQSYDRCR